MNLLADESVDRQIVERLRQDGHEVLYAAEMEPGIPDDVVLERANEISAWLMTADKDFGELVFRDKRSVANQSRRKPRLLQRQRRRKRTIELT